MAAQTTALVVLAGIVGGAMALAGVALLWLTRARPGSRPLNRLGLGPLSVVTHAVVALALIGVGYHIIGHALALRAPLGPLRLAVAIAAVACVCSAWIDRLERRGDARSDNAAAGQDRTEGP